MKVCLVSGGFLKCLTCLSGRLSLLVSLVVAVLVWTWVRTLPGASALRVTLTRLGCVRLFCSIVVSWVLMAMVHDAFWELVSRRVDLLLDRLMKAKRCTCTIFFLSSSWHVDSSWYVATASYGICCGC